MGRARGWAFACKAVGGKNEFATGTVHRFTVNTLQVVRHEAMDDDKSG